MKWTLYNFDTLAMILKDKILIGFKNYSAVFVAYGFYFLLVDEIDLFENGYDGMSSVGLFEKLSELHNTC